MLLLVLSFTVVVYGAESAPIRHIARVLLIASIHGIGLAGFVEVLAGHGPTTHWRIVYHLQLLVLIEVGRLECLFTYMELAIDLTSRCILQLVAVSTEWYLGGLWVWPTLAQIIVWLLHDGVAALT